MRSFFRIKKIGIFLFISLIWSPLLFAQHQPKDGLISYSVGVLLGTNFQEHVLDKNDSPSRPFRSQSFATNLQIFGDLSSKDSLLLGLLLGRHEFKRIQSSGVDKVYLEGATFEFGYRRRLTKAFWGTLRFGSLYAWRESQNMQVRSRPYSKSDISTTYSAILGGQYEGVFLKKNVIYEFKIQKYISRPLEEQVGVFIGMHWRL